MGKAKHGQRAKNSGISGARQRLPKVTEAVTRKVPRGA